MNIVFRTILCIIALEICICFVSMDSKHCIPLGLHYWAIWHWREMPFVLRPLYELRHSQILNYWPCTRWLFSYSLQAETSMLHSMDGGISYSGYWILNMISHWTQPLFGCQFPARLLKYFNQRMLRKGVPTKPPTKQFSSVSTETRQNPFGVWPASICDL